MLLTHTRSIGRSLPHLGSRLRPALAHTTGLAPSLPCCRSWNALRALSATSARRRAASKLDLRALDSKWREKWAALPPDSACETTDAANAKYILPMFPYPSGYLHLGHLRVYTIADVVARFHALRGHNVLLPMGWDAFGLPAENAAIERGVNPAAWTRANIARMKEQLDMMNGSWDWSRVRTCAPPAEHWAAC